MSQPCPECRRTRYHKMDCTQDRRRRAPSAQDVRPFGDADAAVYGYDPTPAPAEPAPHCAPDPGTASAPDTGSCGGGE